jgi:DNA polymerase-3 subunit delta'
MIQAAQGNKPPHGWLLMGDQGIGKATTAYDFAAHILSGRSSPTAAPFSHTKRAICQQTHPDIKVVESSPDAGISIEDIRGLIRFMHTTPVGQAGRIALVDGAQAMTRQAANGLLKILEEPPAHATLLLVAHGDVLPTLRSRCRLLRFSPLSPSQVMEIIQKNQHPSLEKVSAQVLDRACHLAGGSVGRLWTFLEEDSQSLLTSLDNLFLGEGRAQLGDLMDLCRRLKGNLSSFHSLILAWTGDQVKKSQKENFPGKDHQLAQIWTQVDTIFTQAQAANLDSTQTLLRALGTLGQGMKRRQAL